MKTFQGRKIFSEEESRLRRNLQNRRWRERHKKGRPRCIFSPIERRLRHNFRSRRYRKLHGRDFIRHRLSERLRGLFKEKGIKKEQSCVAFIGCSLAEFKKHLAAKFTLGMTWTNRHLWHIDHIKPLAKFDLSKESEQRMAFHYTNLQPLWARDNLRKGANFKSQI